MKTITLIAVVFLLSSTSFANEKQTKKDEDPINKHLIGDEKLDDTWRPKYTDGNKKVHFHNGRQSLWRRAADRPILKERDSNTILDQNCTGSVSRDGKVAGMGCVLGGN